MFFLCSLDGAGAEERIQSAELLDDSISEAPGCETAVFAYAGQSSSSTGLEILCSNHKITDTFLSPQEASVDRDLGNVLCKLSAQHYLPIIAHHRITIEALRHMTAKDLRKVCYLSLCVSTNF